MMVRLKFVVVFLFFVVLPGSINSQVFNNNVPVHFSEWMDTCGFSNPNNFTWTGGLKTLSVQLIDTATAQLVISEPKLNQWYTVTVSNVCDLAGNLIDTQYDTTGFIWKSLPVELNSFTAKAVNQKVKLDWITKTEVNNFGFDIERKSESLSWEKLGFVEGNGNSNSPKEYSYTDKNPVGGRYLKYRLKQIDNDGKFKYSNEIEVELTPVKFVLYQNYPNPFNPTTTIRYQVYQESNISIKVYDILGVEVVELLDEKKEPGIFEIEFNGDNLASGNYVYQLRAGEFIKTMKMSLIK
jgi:Secretion system C-terminal sorting domain